jgi:TetR/AcrR family transcriptional regulator, cholesterol catabolism regulator
MTPAALTPAAESGGMRQRIYEAAIDLFAEKGFHGTSMRDLAAVVGIEAASLYHHFPSKQDLLRAMFDHFMDAILGMIRAASVGPGSPAERLADVVRGHVLFHVARGKEAFISHSELRALTEEEHKRVSAKRDLYEGILRKLLEAGVREGEFEIADIPVTTTAILMMCSGVSDWYDPGGRLTPEAVAERYVELVARLVARPPAPAARARTSLGSGGRHRGGRPAAVRDRDNTSGGGAKSNGHAG